jgi:serine/threonine-protein kinase haspin
VVDAPPDIDRSTTNSKLISIFDDLPPAPVWTSVASKMKKREVKQKPLSPKVVRLLKKKRLSPVLSSVKKPKTGSVARIIGAESCKPKPDSPAGRGIRKTGPALIIDSHPRAPLSAFRLNMPDSPAVSQKLEKSRFPSKKGTPSKLGKPFSPFVDVEIIVFDDEGKIVRKERRVSRTSVGASSARHPPSKDVQVGESGASEPETTGQPRRPKRHIASKQAIIVSDDSESDEGNPPKLTKSSRLGSRTSNLSLQLSKERKVSRTSVSASSTRHLPSKDVQAGESGESEPEITSQPRRPKRHTACKQAIVVSDDSESDGENSQKLTKSSRLGSRTSNLSLQMSKATLHSVVEVVVPPAPYGTNQQKNFKQRSPSQHSPITLHSPVEVSPERIRRQKVVSSTIQPSSPPKGPKQAFLSQQNIPHFVPRPAPAFPLVPSPILKTRQLTPIRGGRNQRLFDPPFPPSPTTPTDFDFSDISYFSTESPSQTQDTYRSEFEVPKYLEPLLEECHQETCGPHNFSAFIESFPFDPITSRGIGDVDITFRKIGEASYSEVFGIGDVVLKVIPIRDESEAGQSLTPGEEDGPAPSDAKDVRKEIIVTRAMGEVYNGFVKLLKNYVVRGRYPEVLLQLWDEYNERKGSESVRPGKDNLL